MQWVLKKFFIVRMLFAGRPIAREMGIFEDFIVDLLAYCI